MQGMAFFLTILTGYTSVTFGTVKVLWSSYGAHFYLPQVAHPVQASPLLDCVLIATLISGGLLLVMGRAVVLVLLSILAVSLYEFFFLHQGPHEFLQIFLLGMIPIGQIMTLYCVLVDYSERQVFPVIRFAPNSVRR